MPSADRPPELELAKSILYSMQVPGSCSPRAWITWFLFTEDSEVAKERNRWWKADSSLTIGLLSRMGGHLVRDRQKEWEEWILSEAVKINTTQARRRVPLGEFVSAKSFKPEQFSREAIAAAGESITATLPFFSGLIRRSLEECRGLCEDAEEGEESDDEDDFESEDEGDEDGDAEDVAGPKIPRFVEAGAKRLKEKLKVKWATEQMSSAFGYNANRRRNLIPHYRGLVTYSTGGTSRLQHYHMMSGYSTSRKSTLRVLKSLTAGRKEELARRVDEEQALVVDNIDIAIKTQIEGGDHQSHQLHLTWGYSLPTTVSIDPSAYDVFDLHKHLKARLPAPATFFLPSTESGEFVESATKAVIFSSIRKHIEGTKIAESKCHPPVVEQAPVVAPKVQPFRLVNKQFGKPDQVVQALDEVRKQLRLTKEGWGARVRFVAADGGGIAHFKTIERQRAPAKTLEESFSNLLYLLGVGHTSWAMGGGVVRFYLGEKLFKRDEVP
ncbi:hypothetical protein P7C70_g9338, partial [Phenoliferia sp. Uapishka_3]